MCLEHVRTDTPFRGQAPLTQSCKHVRSRPLGSGVGTLVWERYWPAEYNSEKIGVGVK